MTVKEKVKLDPRAVPGAYVETPGKLKAYVVKVDPKDSERVIIEYAVKGMGTDSYQVHSLTLIQAAPETEAKQIESDITLSEQSPLDILATEINQLYSECEEAIAVAKSAESSALEHAKQCGMKLLEAKKACGHGKWEKWRNEHLLLPSSTATLYQRIYEGKEELEQAGITTLRGAAELLKKPRQQGLSNQERLERHTEQTKHLFEDPQSVADLPDAEETSIATSEHLETTPSISEEAPSIRPDYGENVSDEIAKGLAEVGVMPCKPSITPEEFNREMAKASLIAPSIRIINPKLKQCEFMSNGEIRTGTIVGLLPNWDTLAIEAVLVDHEAGQSQIPIWKVWLYDENGNAQQLANRFAAIDEVERKGWFWTAHRTVDDDGGYCYSASIVSPKRDIKESFFAQYYEALEDALEHCIEQAKAAGVWEE